MSDEKTPEAQLIRIPVWEQCRVLAYTGNAYGMADRCGVQSTHRESDLLDRLHAGGYEIARRSAVTESGEVSA